MRRRFTNSEKGQQTAEFGAAVVIFITCILLPLADLAVVPVRYSLAQTIVDTYVRQLARSDKASQAFAQAGSDEVQQQLARIGGVKVKDTALQFEITSEKGAETAVDKPAATPVEWLPDGVDCPCSYNLQLKVNCAIEPLFTLAVPGPPTPGLNAPFASTILGRSQWENLGRDPVTREFYLNE